MKDGSNHESKEIQSKTRGKSLTGEKVVLGVLMFVILFVSGYALESVENRWFVFFLWLSFLLCIVVLNNALCTKWLSLDKLQRYKYSWREFGLIILFLYVGSRGSSATPSMSQSHSVGIAMYLFLGYFMFYLSERYVKRTVLKLVLKSVPFLAFFGLVLLALAPYFGALTPSEPKAVRYLDTRSGNVFEISRDDIKKSVRLFSELAEAKLELLSYDSILVTLTEDSKDNDWFADRTSKIERSIGQRIQNIRRLTDEILCSPYKEMLVSCIDLFDNEFLAYSKYMEGIAKQDSMLTEIGTQLDKQVASEYTQLVKRYSALVRVEPGDQIDEQRIVGLLRLEAFEIRMTLNEYEMTLVDFSYGDLGLNEFMEKRRQYEFALADRFKRCDSLIQLIEHPAGVRILGDYLNYDNLDSSIPHQRFQALSALVRAFMSSDSASYADAYDNYYRLCEESEAFWKNFLSSFVFE